MSSECWHEIPVFLSSAGIRGLSCAMNLARAWIDFINRQFMVNLSKVLCSWFLCWYHVGSFEYLDCSCFFERSDPTGCGVPQLLRHPRQAAVARWSLEGPPFGWCGSTFVTLLGAGARELLGILRGWKLRVSWGWSDGCWNHLKSEFVGIPSPFKEAFLLEHLQWLCFVSLHDYLLLCHPTAETIKVRIARLLGEPWPAHRSTEVHRSPQHSTDIGRQWHPFHLLQKAVTALATPTEDGAVLYTVEQDADKAAKAEAIIKWLGARRRWHENDDEIWHMLKHELWVIFEV